MEPDCRREALAALKEGQVRGSLAPANEPQTALHTAGPAWRRLPLGRPPRLIVWAVGVAFTLQFLNGFYNPFLTQYPPVYWTVDIITFALPLVLMATALRTGQLSAADLGIRSTTDYQHGRLNFVVLLLTTPIVTPIVFVVAEGWSRRLFPQDWGYVLPALDVLPASFFWRGVIVYYLSISAGVVEELVYRAALLLVLPRRFALNFGYIAVSAVLFGLIHWEQGPDEVVAKVVFGAFMALLYRGPRNIWPPIIAHTLLDLMLTWSPVMHPR